jgi:signal transduction histidine kinase
VLAASANLGDSGPITDRLPGERGPEPLDLSGVRDDDETEDYRVWAVSASGVDGPAVVYVGHSTEAAGEAVASLVGALALGIPLVLVAAAVLLWHLVGRTLAPVEQAMRRQRTFVADAAHELQSPLAAYRTSLEVALEHPARTDWPRTARTLLADGARMEQLVRDLLFLARQDATPAEHRLVDLDDVVLEEARRLRVSARVALDTSGVSAAPVRGSRGDLGRMVRNLLANADQHAASAVTVRLSAEPDGVRLEVYDDGPGVRPEDRDRIFDRFFRGDEARGHRAGSTGLGLAIARSVAERHGGTLTLGEPTTGAELVAMLPPA